MRLRTMMLTAMLSAGLSEFPLDAAPGGRQAASAAEAPAEEALSGLDPVLLVQGKEVDGAEAQTVTHQGLVYYFASAESKAAFLREPARYAVQLDGMCARMGPPVPGSQGLYAVHAGHVYVFGTENCRKLFVATPAKFIDTAPSLMPAASADATRRGRALLEQAVAAMGGAAVDRLTTYRETSRSVIPTMRGDVTMTNTLTVAFPGRWRRDSSSSFGEGSVVVTQTDAFTSGARRAPRPLPPAARAVQNEALTRTPLQLLRARETPAFRAVALDTRPAPGILEVAVALDGRVSVLGIDEHSGRIVSQRFRGRSPQSGEYGEIRTSFSDFKPAGPLTLPFQIEGRFDGTVLPQLGQTIDAIDVDLPVDPGTFSKPSA